MQQMNSSTDRFDLSLRLRHESATLTDIIRALSATPDVSWEKGDPRRTPSGKMLSGAYQFSYCSIPIDGASVADLDEALRLLVKRLDRHKTTIRDFVATGGVASAAVGWFMDNTTGARIQSATIALLADFRVTVDLYLYKGISARGEAE